ncbi:hypothetical protein [Paenibacillus wynnii]|uniref:Uncharacterized protein n=1 Tax=Paenibacillus wynnii TaxID=268407 RepID=A0A098M3F7_9BACL|nr:hypothetical protein [Paenibacillus wynnii]KGE16536.1 hypothetical protein PWYN_17595 [Paenibacillus wynnii]
MINYDNLGPGVEPIPEPDKSEEGREGLKGLDEVVGGIMDNVQMALIGNEKSDLNADRNTPNQED